MKKVADCRKPVVAVPVVVDPVQVEVALVVPVVEVRDIPVAIQITPDTHFVQSTIRATAH